MKSSIQELQSLADHVRDKAMDGDTPFAETLDAFGKLITYHGLLLKNQGKLDEPSDEPTMTALAATISEGNNGSGPGKRLPARSR